MQITPAIRQERIARSIRLYGDADFGGLTRFNVQTKAVVSEDRWSVGNSNCDTMEQVERVVEREVKWAEASGATLTVKIIDRDLDTYAGA